MHVAVHGLTFDEIAYKKIVFDLEICIDLYIGCVISIALYRSAKYAGGLENFLGVVGGCYLEFLRNRRPKKIATKAPSRLAIESSIAIDGCLQRGFEANSPYDSEHSVNAKLNDEKIHKKHQNENKVNITANK